MCVCTYTYICVHVYAHIFISNVSNCFQGCLENGLVDEESDICTMPQRYYVYY